MAPASGNGGAAPALELVVLRVADLPAARAFYEAVGVTFVEERHGGGPEHVAEPVPGTSHAFDHLGPRVPAFVVSPFARRNYVSHVVHDHTSVLRFIETKWNLGALTRRDANASNLLDCFDFRRRRPAFLDPPELAAPGLPATGSACQPETPPPPTSASIAAAVDADAPLPGLGLSAPALAATVDPTTGAPTAPDLTTAPLTDSQDVRLHLLHHLARQ
ncbi:MAG TPA: alkaline phosphatase family protein [Acidimicrobiales bacterium]|nr:alkaline phosphatase family protein [Acidimicrobiales bacterium]